jgi:hypothetical protein
MPHRIVEVRRWQIVVSFLAVTIAFVVGLAWIVHVQDDVNRKNHDRITDLVRLQLEVNRKNQARVNDIQHDRVVSCRRTYEGVREIFKPLLPPPPKLTVRERRNLRIFNHRIDQLKAHCPGQTGTN